MTTVLPNYVAGAWRAPSAAEHLDVPNPATGEVLARVPLTPAEAVGDAVEAAERAFLGWRRVPAVERVQFLFRLKGLLERRREDLCRTLSEECGKTLAESRGELLRGIENVEVACGIPSLMQGTASEDIARGIDEYLFREPLGVVAAITPFNFPGMIPLWFLPYALACGNCFLLKPSEKTPITSVRLFELVEELGLPPGVLQLVHGGAETVQALLEHPGVRAISFVGSTPTARRVYSGAAGRGKRAQCQGGAKNPAVILPDADMETTARVVADAAFGCAGQRCLALSSVLMVGSAAESFTPLILEAARTRRVGCGLEEGVEMGPVIRPESRDRILGLLGQAEREGAAVPVDGRGKTVPGYEGGTFLFPTVLEDLPPESEVARTEIFGPVLSLSRVPDLDAAIRQVNGRGYGNMACVFTTSGPAARRFRQEVSAGNVGVNVGVAAPMAFFPFSGWNESFFGDLHAQGRHAVEFYTQTKVVVERWPREWTRRF